jgi:hypothetical protein
VSRRRNPKLVLQRGEMFNVEPLVQVALAIIAQAVADAYDAEDPSLRREAVAWLKRDGAAWVEVLIGETDCIEAWFERLAMLAAA